MPVTYFLKYSNILIKSKDIFGDIDQYGIYYRDNRKIYLWKSVRLQLIEGTVHTGTNHCMECVL